MGKWKKRSKNPSGWKKVPLNVLQQRLKKCKKKDEKAFIQRKINHIIDWVKANVTTVTYYPDRHKPKKL